MDQASLGLLWLRLLAGYGIATHGYAKVFGGGIGQMTEGVAGMGFPLPAVFAWAASLSEFAGGVCLALGLGTRVAAAFIFITMSVAFLRAHAADLFATKELAFLYWAISGALIAIGGGRFSLDALIKRRR